jgi:hypothetical protein
VGRDCTHWKAQHKTALGSDGWVLILANRKYVHVPECQWIGRFECVPVIEIVKLGSAREMLLKLVDNLRRDLKTEK